MKFRTLLFYTLSIFICSYSFGQQQDWFSPDSLRRLVSALSHDSMQGRLTGTKECMDAARFISNEFKTIGLEPYTAEDGYFMPVKKNFVNVIGGIHGRAKAGEIIIFSCHYDHIGTANTYPYPNFPTPHIPGDTIYNGANDNASGVAAVITLARYFAERKNNERTIMFIAFGGEELGLLGSEYFASQFDTDSIIAVINIEMIGKKQGSNVFITGADLSTLREILNEELTKADPVTYKKKFFSRDLSNMMLFERSDNYPFAKRGVPAHTIMTTNDSDEHYHTANDETHTLNYDFMSRVVKAIGLACEGLVTGKDTPLRLKSIR